MESSLGREKNSASSSSISAQCLTLAEVVVDCTKRCFKDSHKEAKNDDINMQVLVAQMYYTGYSVTKDPQKEKLWMTKASKSRSSVRKVSNKRPGYNASDSNSDEPKADS